MKRYSKNTQEEGAALVEFAIVIPLLLLLVLGIIEFGYTFYHLNILNKSVEDGARYFSDPRIARYNGSGASLSYPINVKNTSNASGGNAPYILNMKNLVIYGNIAGTGTQLLPDTAPTPTVYCAEENTSNAVCATATKHIMVTATYTHYFILKSALNTFTFGTVPPVFYTLTASSVLRVE